MAEVLYNREECCELLTFSFIYFIVTKESKVRVNFTVTPCINDIKYFIIQLMHTTLKNLELLKHFKIKEVAPTCFGLQGNHHQGATAST